MEAQFDRSNMEEVYSRLENDAELKALYKRMAEIFTNSSPKLVIREVGGQLEATSNYNPDTLEIIIKIEDEIRHIIKIRYPEISQNPELFFNKPLI